MKKWLLLCGFFISSNFAAEHQVKMLSWGEEGSMVFEPAVLQIAVGDTVTFLPTQSGHHIKSMEVPVGAESFASKLDEKFSVTLTEEGIYTYICPPHRAMNMSGLIQVGAPINRQAITASVAEIEQMAQSNKGRMTKYLEQLDALNK